MNNRVGRVLSQVMVVSTAVWLSSCGKHADSGPVVTETREVEAFTAIDVNGASKLEITIGEPLSVVIQGHEEAVRRVETDVSGETLRIRARVKDWMIRNKTQRLTLQIKVPHLRSLELEGGNDVIVTGLVGGEFKIKSSGATNIKAQGQLQELTVRMSGAGNADLSELLTDAAKVTVDGVGNVIVSPRESLDATMNGVGAIFYTGSPQRVNTHMNGLGTISQKDGNAAPPPAEPQAPVDPDKLQPEYDEHEKTDPKKDQTEVI